MDERERTAPVLVLDAGGAVRLIGYCQIEAERASALRVANQLQRLVRAEYDRHLVAVGAAQLARDSLGGRW